jgi:hypothetical protein
MFGRYALELRRTLRSPVTVEECLDQLRHGVETREQAFVDVLGRALRARPHGVYARLLAHAGVELGDVRRLVDEQSVEGALEELHAAGVYVALEEFRGERPIERSGLSIPVSQEAFDNPLVRAARETRTGGSRSEGRRIQLNLQHFDHGTLYPALFLAAHDALSRPKAIWHPVFPSRTGLNNVLHGAKLGQPIDKWFSQSDGGSGRQRLKASLLTQYGLLACRLWSTPGPAPEHVPLSDAGRIARWLQETKREGRPALLSAPVGSGVRVALAAREQNLDIAGTLFRLGGEPLTPARAAVVEATGSRAFSNYAMGEVGRVGVACAVPAAVDDLHLMTNKLAVIQRSREVPATGERVNTLLFTTVQSSAPKLMLNVETDDYAVVEDRLCGCLIGELGFSRHLRDIRSWEKLTSEGMSIRITDVLPLLEETLPARFGGAPTDYQLAEEVNDELPRVVIVVSPSVGKIDEDEVIATVLDGLAHAGLAPELASRIWRDGTTLAVERREPYATPGWKIHAVHVSR